MKSMTILFALYLLLSSATVFAGDDKSANKAVNEGLTEVQEGAKKLGRAAEEAVKKGVDNVDKTAKKMFKKNGQAPKKPEKDKAE